MTDRRHRLTRRLAALAVIALGVPLGGCPGDDDAPRPDAATGAPQRPDGALDWTCLAGREERVCRREGPAPEGAGAQWSCTQVGPVAECRRPVASSWEPWLEIGTGGVGRFEPVADGDVAHLARGCQGSQHFWVSLRAANLDLRPAIINLLFVRERDGETVSIPLQVRLRFERVDGAPYDDLTGLALVVPDPDAALGEAVTLRARVGENSPGGVSVRAERHVTVAWGDEVCGARPDGGAVPRGDGGAGDAAAVDAGGPLRDGGG